MGKGKRNRERSRRHADRGERWTTSSAARDAIRRRDHTIANSEDNPFVGRLERIRLESGLRDWIAGERSRGMPKFVATRSAYRTMFGAVGFRPPYDDLDALARTMLEEDPAALRSSQLYVVSPSMHRVVLTAALTLDTTDLLTLFLDEDVPAPTGLVVLPEPIIVRNHDDALSDHLAYLWQRTEVQVNRRGEWVPGVRVTSMMDTNGPVQNEAFRAVRGDAASLGCPLPLLLTDGRTGLRGDRFRAAVKPTKLAKWKEDTDEAFAGLRDVATLERGAANREDLGVDAEYAGGILDDPTMDLPLRYMFAFWRLCNQQISVVRRHADERNGQPRGRLDDVRVVRLRAWTPEDQSTGGGERVYKHRWVVRMHKVRQWYPSEGVHKVIWRGPYIKGPDGAPLLDGDKVYALTR